MNDAEAITFYVETIAEQVRSMPIYKAVPFLKGALLVAGEHPAMESLRGTMIELASADDQLEQLMGKQLRLPLDGHHGNGKAS